MRFALSALVVCVVLHRSSHSEADPPAKAAADVINIASANWPWWRGPTRNGVAVPNPMPPLKWSDTDNVHWQSPVPGRGHGSPIVVGDQVFLAAADEQAQTQSVLGFDRRTGKLLWQTKITDYILHQGFGSSPAVYEDLVLVTADNKGTGAIAALERTSGKVVWKHARPQLPNYASPIVLKVAGRDQMLVTGCDLVSSFEPRTGKKLWEIQGSTEETVTSTVTDGAIIVASGGYPKKHVMAIRADGSGEVVWEHKTQVYVPSMLMHQGFLYAVADNGIAYCWKSHTGKEAWSGRLEGTFTASPILVGEHIYVTSETGRTYVFKATPQGLDVIAENQLGHEVMATPAICGGRIYMRVAVNEQGRRQEMLVCVGEAAK